MKLTLIAGVTASQILSAVVLNPAMALEPVGLNVARMAEPVGIDEPAPTLRWSIRAGGCDVRQGAYSVRIASRPDRLPKADVWKSGRINSSRPEMTILAVPALRVTLIFQFLSNGCRKKIVKMRMDKYETIF